MWKYDFPVVHPQRSPLKRFIAATWHPFGCKGCNRNPIFWRPSIQSIDTYSLLQSWKNRDIQAAMAVGAFWMNTSTQTTNPLKKRRAEWDDPQNWSQTIWLISADSI